MVIILKLSGRLPSKLNPHNSLRTSLGMSIGGIAFLLSIFASLIVGHTASEQVKLDVGRSLAELAYQMTDKLDRGMFERYRDIKIISTLDIFRNRNSSVFQQRALLEKLQSTYNKYAWIGLTNNRGIVVASTGKLLEGKDISQRSWFIEGQKSPYVGDVHDAVKLAKLLPNSTGEPLRFVDLAIPVKDLQGNAQGVLGAHLSWSWSREVQKSLLNSQERHKTEIFILRQDGDLLLSPSGFKAANLQSLNSLQAAQKGYKNYLIETWPDGQTYITGFAQSVGYRNYPGLGWLILVRQKTDIAFAPVRRLQQQIFTWNMALGLIFAILGWLVAAVITNPILAIATAANDIRSGNKLIKIPVLKGKDEIANLSQSLSQMVFTLTQQESDLKASNIQLQTELTSKLVVQEMLCQSEQKFRQLAENIQEIFWLKNIFSNEIIYISPVYEQIWGRSCESLYTNPNSWIDAVHLEDKEYVLATIDNNHNNVYSHEYRIIQPDNSVRWIWERSFLVKNNFGEVYRRVGIAQDITDRKQAEETRLALEKEKEISELKSRFISIASHEFRTPLTSILLSCELLKKYSQELTDEKKERYFYQIKSAVTHLNQVVEDILVIGKAEAGKLNFDPAPLNLINFCLQIVEEQQFNAGDRYHINFVERCFDASKTQDLPLMDEKLLRHILTNLLSNAIKYSPEGGNVQFELTCDQQNARFRIQDQGIGIPQADQAKLFTSFFRCSNTEKISGNGIGLTIVKSAVELHGGQISVESEVGLGTTFTVILPLTYAIAADTAESG